MSYSSGSPRRPSRIRSVSAQGEHGRNTMSELDEPLRTKTGRISKALKGLRVHACDQCGKVYSRREHLKRHQFNHERSPLQCKVCHKAFFRKDLLERHVLKYGHPSSHSPSCSPERDTSSVASMCTSQISAGLRSDSTVPMTTFENVKTILASAETEYPSFVSSLDPNLPSRPHFPMDQQIWQRPSIASKYPILPPSPVSGVSSPWLTSSYNHPSLSVVDSIEPFPNPYSNMSIPAINSSSPPGSTSPSKWELLLEHDRRSLATSTSSSPAPVSAVPPVLLPVSGGTTDELLQNNQLSGILMPLRQKTYQEAFWKHFHPVFPIIHSKQRFMQSSSTPTSMQAKRWLAVTIMAIGAQYSKDWSAPGDSRILHEKCQEVFTKNKASIVSSSAELESMQAVVLAEFLSQFKAKRAPEGLSETFRAIYDNLLQWHFSQPKSRVEELNKVTSSTSEESTRSKWADWIEFHSRERLLSACYTLDSRNALLFGRQMHIFDPSVGLGLFTPVSNSVWDAHSQSRWTQALLRQRPHPSTIDQLLEKIDCAPDTSCDNFQSAVVLACYSASILSQSQDTMGLTCPTHTLFEPFRAADLKKALSKHTSVRIMHAAIRLVSLIPFRALVATAGESWFFGKKIGSVAKDGAQEFNNLKGQLKAWTSDSTSFIMDSVNSSSTLFLASISLALEIISTAVSDSSPNQTLIFGPELALYFASLVCWAATFSAQQATGSQYQSHGSDAAKWDALRAENLVRSFLPHAISDVKQAYPDPSLVPPQSTDHHHNPQFQHIVPAVAVDGIPLQEVMPGLVPGLVPANQPMHHQFAAAVGAIFPPPVLLSSWRQGVSSTLRWTAWVLGGAANSNSGMGELIQGLVEVLETLGRAGWTGDWF